VNNFGRRSPAVIALNFNRSASKEGRFDKKQQGEKHEK